jgi:uncharacterized alkaline shock family protein YloU
LVEDRGDQAGARGRLGTIAREAGDPEPGHPEEVTLSEPVAPVPGRTFVTAGTVAALTRYAAAACYGVVAVSGPRALDDLRGWLGLGTPGVSVRLRPEFRVALYLSVARGVPVAEVAHNAEEAVRYALRRALGREPVEIEIHVAGLRVVPRGRGALDPPSDDERPAR